MTDSNRDTFHSNTRWQVTLKCKHAPQVAKCNWFFFFTCTMYYLYVHVTVTNFCKANFSKHKGRSKSIIHRQLSHIWFTYEYHMRIICFVSYENHKKRASYVNHMWQIIWLTYDIHMWIIWKSYERGIICESYESYKALSYENHMKGASYVNHMNHICVLYLCTFILWKTSNSVYGKFQDIQLIKSSSQW